MLQFEASLSFALDGEPCLAIEAQADRWVVTFVSATAFRRTLQRIRETAVPGDTAMPEPVRKILLSQRVVVRVGGEEVAEIVPGEPTSLAARLAGVRVPGLRLRGSGLLRLLVSGG